MFTRFNYGIGKGSSDPNHGICTFSDEMVHKDKGFAHMLDCSTKCAIGGAREGVAEPKI